MKQLEQHVSFYCLQTYLSMLNSFGDTQNLNVLKSIIFIQFFYNKTVELILQWAVRAAPQHDDELPSDHPNTTTSCLLITPTRRRAVFWSPQHDDELSSDHPNTTTSCLLITPTRRRAAFWSPQHDDELSSDHPNTTTSCLLITPTRRRAVFWSPQHDDELSSDHPNTTTSCLLITPTRRRAVFWSPQHDDELSSDHPNTTTSCLLITPTRRRAVFWSAYMLATSSQWSRVVLHNFNNVTIHQQLLSCSRSSLMPSQSIQTCTVVEFCFDIWRIQFCVRWWWSTRVEEVNRWPRRQPLPHVRLQGTNHPGPLSVTQSCGSITSTYHCETLLYPSKRRFVDVIKQRHYNIFDRLELRETIAT